MWHYSIRAARDAGTTNLRLDSPHIRAGVVLGEPTSGARPSPPDVCGSTWWKPWKRQNLGGLAHGRGDDVTFAPNPHKIRIPLTGQRRSHQP
jgi:hypothetical protein